MAKAGEVGVSLSTTLSPCSKSLFTLSSERPEGIMACQSLSLRLDKSDSMSAASCSINESTEAKRIDILRDFLLLHGKSFYIEFSACSKKRTKIVSSAFIWISVLNWVLLGKKWPSYFERIGDSIFYALLL